MTSPASASPLRATELQPSKPLPPNGRRRDKAQLSCMLCRHRKLRCDRSQPCQNCAKRGQSCIYVNSPSQAKSGQTGRQYPAYLNSLHERIRHLEGVVLNLVNNKETAQGHPGLPESQSQDAPTEPQVVESVGRLSIEDNGTSYFGSSTWQAILNEIEYMKDLIPESTDSPFTDRPRDLEEDDGLDLLMEARKYFEPGELFNSVPPRSVVDPLICHFFENMEISPLILHSPTFRKEYENFRRDPTTASIIWLSMVFGMMSLSSSFLLLSNVDPEREESLRMDVREYRERCAQCLISGNYTKPGKYNLPALIIYLACERMRKEEFDHGLPILFAMIVSLALRMGYHRDASHYPNLSPFAGEIRRRLWAVVVQLDQMISVAVGVPRLIDDSKTDNSPPRNLREEDFSEDSAELPPPRPLADPTVVTYVLARLKLIRFLGKTTDLANATVPPRYETVLEFDRELSNIYGQLPTFYKLGEGPDTQDSLTFLQRLSFESLYEQARCTLHRKYLTAQDPRYAYSREACVDAAMNMLAQQRYMHRECQAGKKLFPQRWKLLTYLNRENLLAAMIVCLDVDQALRNIGASSNPTAPLSNPALSLESKIQALEQSFGIWQEYRSMSKEASTAAHVVQLTIRKAKAVCSSRDVSEGSFGSGTSNSTSPVQSLQGEQFAGSAMDYSVTTTAAAAAAAAEAAAAQYMIGMPHGGGEGSHHQYGVIGEIPENQAQQQQQAEQLQYRPDAMMYQQPDAMMAQETSRGSMEAMAAAAAAAGMSSNPAYKVMETMIDAPVQFGWGAFWDPQFPRDYTTAGGVTAEDVWTPDRNGGGVPPPPPPPAPGGSSGGALGYQG
ncbi:conserved hypothetical protein [Coccidioides posadasii str. Silveira]|uniref:C6 finger domain transcription factor nscR n=2 Tax=Coccidioides posadasii (strain RMSCC 757 / Silveira) TaxID=443226 RepID=E9DK56_COCPS|nr:conserved hypothetical protein [Coccidioides posadasii str. Silveira]